MTHEGILVLMQQRRWQEALVLCQQAVHALPNDARAQALLGVCLFHMGRYDEALPPLRCATVLDPKCWEAGLKLAQCYDRLHRHEEAYATAAEWLKVQPNQPQLQGIVHLLEHQVRGNRTDGWERTRGLERQVHLASEC